MPQTASAAPLEPLDLRLKLHVRPLTLKQANERIEALHRHHKRVQGHRFTLGAFLGDTCVGVCVVGRPVARALDPTKVAEVTRLATDGTKNACSILYAAAARACAAMGFETIQTYTLLSEPGASLRGAGWVCEGQVRRDGVGWNNRRGRRTDQPTEPKQRWCKELNR